MVELAHLVREFFHLGFERAQVVEYRHAFVKDRPAGELQSILRQVAKGRVLRAGNAAVVERLQPSQHLQQSGLTSAVGTQQPDARLRGDEPIEVVEEEFGAEALTG